MRSILMLLTSFVILLLIIGCDRSDSDTVGPGEDEGRLQMYLVDAPTNIYSEVNIVIERVEIYSASEGWIQVKGQAESYNLLELTNGRMALLADVNINAGTYTKIRVLLGGGNHIVIDGQVIQLSISSAFQTGIELEYEFQIHAGATVELLLDFDAHRSVITVGGVFILQPVIRVESMDQTGNIAGRVAPVEARAVIIASQEGEVVTSTYANEDSGEFKLVGLPSGEYTVEVVARTEGYKTFELSGVVVEVRQTTDLGLITLEEVEEPVPID